MQSTSAKPADAASNPETGGLRSHVIRGILVVGVASVLMRSGGLIAQFIAGKILIDEDFGLYASTLVFSGLAVSMLSSMRPVIIERLTKGENVDDLWRLVLGIMLGLAVIILIFRNQLASLFDRPEAGALLGAVAFTLPLQFSQVIGVARLGAQLRFTESSRILTISTLARHSSLVIAVLAGAGVWSFVIPLYVEPITQALLLWRAAGPPPSLRGPALSAVSTYRNTLPWLLLSAVALAVSLNGDYLAISPLESLELVGLYSFGYLLSAALTQPFTMAATNVLVPSFASVDDNDRVRRSYLEAVSILLATTGIAFGGLALLGGPIVHILWSGKWDPAVVAVALISIGTPFRILQPTCYSLLQARGLWQKNSLLMVLNACSSVIGAVIGALVGGLQEIAIGVAIAGTATGAAVAVVAGLEVDSSPLTTIKQLLRGMAPATLGLALAFAVVPGYIPSLAMGIARSVLFTVVSVAVLVYMFRQSLSDIISSARGR